MACEWLDAYLLDKPGARRDYQPVWQWERYWVGDKMFAATCRPDEKHAFYGGKRLLTLKCDPLLAPLLRERYPDVVPGFYMDKARWNSVFLEGETPESVLREMCDASYRLVFEKLTKKLQKEILSGK